MKNPVCGYPANQEYTAAYLFLQTAEAMALAFSGQGFY
jgi:hypothetical protein